MKGTLIVSALIFMLLLSARAASKGDLNSHRIDSEVRIWAMTENRRNNLWTSSHDEGSFRFSPGSDLPLRIATNGLDSRSTRVVLEDQKKHLRIGSGTGGLRQLALALSLPSEGGASLTSAVVSVIDPTFSFRLGGAVLLLGLVVAGIWAWTRTGIRRPWQHASCKEAETLRSRQDLTHAAQVSTLAEIAGSIAHELNQPLSAILINAQAARQFLKAKSVDLEEVREIVEDIIALSRRAADTTGRMRARLRKGEAQMEPQDLNQVMGEVMEMVRSELLWCNVVATATLARNLPQVEGDRVQLQQVLMNLIVNACEAMKDCPTAERRLTVRTELIDEGVKAAVSDSGHGFPPEMIEQAFRPFHSTKTDRLGLGLAICRSIVQAHGGRIWLTNNDKGGATVGFTLPVHAEPSPLD